jgi:hypothetical protein
MCCPYGDKYIRASAVQQEPERCMVTNLQHQVFKTFIMYMYIQYKILQLQVGSFEAMPEE